MNISGATALTGIFGDPVDHSLSPAMHNAAYEALGLDRAYVPFRVRSAELPAAVKAVASLGMLGVNVTVPHKEAVARLVGRNLSHEARVLGAVNCIVNRNGRLYGDNSDALGLQRALEDARPFSRSRKAIIIGAGGGAVAAVLACSRLGAEEIVIFNRTAARAQRSKRRFPKLNIEARPLRALGLRRAIEGAGLVVNATPLGLKGLKPPKLDFDSASQDCIFYDLLYSRDTTPFLEAAENRGFRAIDGAQLLLHQGALAFKLFNRIDPPIDVMRRALMEKLGR